MSARITAADVGFLTLRPKTDGDHFAAQVQGANRVFVVDRLDGKWFCSCRVSTAHAPRECPHIRAAKEALKSWA